MGFSRLCEISRRSRASKTPGGVAVSNLYFRQVERKYVEKFQQAITSIPTLKDIPADLTCFPNVQIDKVFLDHPEYLEMFKKSVVDFGKEIKS